MAELQQQITVLEAKLQHAGPPQLQQDTTTQPLQEQQLPQNLAENPAMAQAVADAPVRPQWQNPMAVHLSDAEKAGLRPVAEASGAKALADENGAPQSLLAGNPGLQQWEEKKKMQKRIDTLQAKLKVQPCM